MNTCQTLKITALTAGGLVVALFGFRAFYRARVGRMINHILKG